MESFCRIAFGKELGLLTQFLQGNNDPIPFASSFDQAQQMTDFRVVNPFWKITEHLDGSRQKMNQCCKVIDDFAYQVINERRADPDAAEYSDLLSRFMNAKKEGSQEGFNNLELKDVLLNMIM
jgi:cytochrome P450